MRKYIVGISTLSYINDTSIYVKCPICSEWIEGSGKTILRKFGRHLMNAHNIFDAILILVGDKDVLEIISISEWIEREMKQREKKVYIHSD